MNPLKTKTCKCGASNFKELEHAANYVCAECGEVYIKNTNIAIGDALDSFVFTTPLIYELEEMVRTKKIKQSKIRDAIQESEKNEKV